MRTNKEDCPSSNQGKGPCCHCCDKCYPRTRIERGGKCGICARLGRKCPFGLDAATKQELTSFPQFRYDPASSSLPKTQEKTPLTTFQRPSSAARHNIIGSPSIGQGYRSNVHVHGSVVRQVYIPIYPVVEIQPVYYNVTVPLRIEGLKTLLTNSTVEDVQYEQETSLQAKENHPLERMKHSSSTFDRSKMKLSLLESRQRNLDGVIHPDELRTIINGFSEG